MYKQKETWNNNTLFWTETHLSLRGMRSSLEKQNDGQFRENKESKRFCFFFQAVVDTHNIHFFFRMVSRTWFCLRTVHDMFITLQRARTYAHLSTTFSPTGREIHTYWLVTKRGRRNFFPRGYFRCTYMYMYTNVYVKMR